MATSRASGCSSASSPQCDVPLKYVREVFEVEQPHHVTGQWSVKFIGVIYLVVQLAITLHNILEAGDIATCHVQSQDVARDDDVLICIWLKFIG